MRNMIDIGSGFYYSFFQWAPDWSINTREHGQPDHIDQAGVILWRLEPIAHDQQPDDDAPDGYVWDAVGTCWFDTPETRAVIQDKTPVWEVKSLKPLHIEPSIQMYHAALDKDGKSVPSHHGYIRSDVWVKA